MSNFIIPNNPGAIPDIPDIRDYSYEQIFGAVSLPEEYDIIKEVGGLSIKNQGTSQSCVGQSWSYYTEILERIENKNETNLSAKDIYSQIFIEPNGGASIRDGATLLQKSGVTLEILLSSYNNGNPPDENWMRDRSMVTLETINKALVYRAKSYATIWHKEDIEIIKQAIFQNHGVITGVYGDNPGWQNKIVLPPINYVWGHAILLVGWRKVDGVEMLKFINSWGTNWGEGGFGFLHPSYLSQAGNMFNLWTLVDMPNYLKPQFMFKLIKKSQDAKEVFAVTEGKRYWILDAITFEAGRKNLWPGWEDITIEDPLQYEYGGAIFLSQTDDPLK